MHQALFQSSLSHLPPRFKAAATTAMRGSRRDMYDFVESMASATPDIPLQYFRRLLPVFNAALEPIPHAALAEQPDVEAQRDALRDVVNRAVFAIRGIMHVYDAFIRPESVFQVPPPRALLEIWPRIWFWIDFHHTFGSLDPLFEESSDVVRGHNLMAVFVFMRQPGLTRAILNTPGLIALVGAAWRRELSRRRPENDSVVAPRQAPFPYDGFLHTITDILADVQHFRDSGHAISAHVLEELAVGAGSVHQLAKVCISQIKYALPTPTCMVRDEDLEMFRVVFDAITLRGDAALDGFQDALRERKVFTRLVVVMRAIQNAPKTYHGPSLLKDCCDYVLRSIFIDPPLPERPALLAEAIRAGFMRVLFDYWGRLPAKLPQAIVNDILIYMQQDIPLLLCCRRVVSALDETAPKSLHELDAGLFRNAVLREAWEGLVEVMHARLGILWALEDGKWTGAGGCDNAKCQRGVPDAVFKRCGGCYESWYCSRSCQEQDWRFGHKELCGFGSRLEIADKSGIDSRSYIRAVLDYEYNTQKENIALDVLCILRCHPTSAPPLPSLLFEYRKGARSCKISVKCISCERDAGSELANLHSEDIERSAASGGTLQVHFIQFGSYPDYFIPFPLYSPEGSLFNEMEALAKELRDADGGRDMEQRDFNGDLYRERVREILQVCAGERH